MISSNTAPFLFPSKHQKNFANAFKGIKKENWEEKG